jgi:hypothetical protein
VFYEPWIKSRSEEKNISDQYTNFDRNRVPEGLKVVGHSQQNKLVRKFDENTMLIIQVISIQGEGLGLAVR